MIEWPGSSVFATATWKTIWISGKIMSSSSMMQLEPTVQNTQVPLMMEKQHCLLLADFDISFLLTALFTRGRNFAKYQQSAAFTSTLTNVKWLLVLIRLAKKY